MTRILTFLFSILVISCSSSVSNSNDLESTSDSVDKNYKDLDHQKVPRIISKNQLLGTWTDGTTENATMDIGHDSIFYVDQFQSFPYILKGDSITIIFPDMSYEGIAYFISDTLVLEDSEFGTSKFTRFKD